MLLLEKLFQQNDKIFLIFTNIFNFFIFYIVSYCLIILKYHSIYELLEVKLFIESPEFIFINYILLFIYIVSNLFITSYYNFNYKEYLTRFIFNLFISFLVFFFLISDYKISFFIVIYPAILFVISILVPTGLFPITANLIITDNGSSTNVFRFIWVLLSGNDSFIILYNDYIK